jgi:hypothetical protein
MASQAHQQQAALARARTAEQRAAEQFAGVVTPWGWRPAWEGPGGDGGPLSHLGFRLPSTDQLDHVQKLVTVTLLLLALPVLVLTLIRNPRALARQAARKQLG